MPVFETTPSSYPCSYFSDEIRVIHRRTTFDILVLSKSFDETIYFESRKHGDKIYVHVLVWNTKQCWGQTLGLLHIW